VPLLAHGETQGVLSIFDTRPERFDLDQIGFFTILGQQVGTAIQNARLFDQVRVGNERLQMLSHRLVEVQEEERRTIARELHDEVGQILTGLNLTLELVARLPPEKVPERLEQGRTLVNDLMQRVREMSLALRPPMLDDLGLLPTLLWHFERYTSQTSVQVNFKQSGLERRFDSEVETTVYRMVQEALTNVARYAQVNSVEVRIWSNSSMLAVQVEDQGCGFDPERALNSHSSSGLSGIRERTLLLGGQFAIETAPGSGTALSIEFGLDSAAEQAEQTADAARAEPEPHTEQIQRNEL
jgi:signal transduction histidine kinase